MAVIDQAQFNFSPAVGLVVAVMVGFLVFAVALDLTWDQFRRVLSRPKAPLIGLVAQYLILPGVAFGVGELNAERGLPSNLQGDGLPGSRLGLTLAGVWLLGSVAGFSRLART